MAIKIQQHLCSSQGNLLKRMAWNPCDSPEKPTESKSSKIWILKFSTYVDFRLDFNVRLKKYICILSLLLLTILSVYTLSCWKQILQNCMAKTINSHGIFKGPLNNQSTVRLALSMIGAVITPTHPLLNHLSS